MKILFIFFILTFFTTLISTSKIQNNSEVIHALSGAIRELFVRNKINFDFLTYGNVTPHIRDVIDGLRSSDFVTKILHWNSERNVYNSAVIFVESKDKIIEFCWKNVLERLQMNFAKRLRFLFYVEKSFNNTQLEENPLNAGVGQLIWFSYFLINHKSKNTFGNLRFKIINF